MRRRGTPYHGVLYAGLMITDGRAEGARVQLPLRRSRDAGGAAAPALRPGRALPGVARARRPRGRHCGVHRRLGGDAWCSPPAGYPDSSSKGDVISGLSEAAALDGVEVTHAGTARRQRRDRHRRRPGAERDRARLDTRRGTRARLRGRRADLVRRHADAYRHRCAGGRRGGNGVDETAGGAARESSRQPNERGSMEIIEPERTERRQAEDGHDRADARSSRRCSRRSRSMRPWSGSSWDRRTTSRRCNRRASRCTRRASATRSG